MLLRRRHSRTIDLSAIANEDHRRILQEGLNAVRYPLGRIRRNTGRTVPVIVSDLSRYARDISRGGPAHVHGPDGETGHVLAYRQAPLGLYWLPTAEHPAGRIEVGLSAMSDPDLAREVLIAELAHAVDYGVPLTDDQRRQIADAYHAASPHEHTSGDPHGWFEERGDQDYWDWVGESFMAGFMRAFAPSLPRPLESRQPWKHPSTDEVARVIRRVLR